MNFSNCSHHYRVFCKQDKPIEIRCLFCYHCIVPQKGIDDCLIEKIKFNLIHSQEIYQNKLKHDPQNRIKHQTSIQVLQNQIDVCNAFLTSDDNESMAIIPNTDPVTVIEEKPDPPDHDDPAVTPKSDPDQSTRYRQLDILTYLESLEPLKKRRHTGEGSGEIVKRKSKPKEGKIYEQLFFRVSFWQKGKRKWRKSFYIPRHLEQWVIDSHDQHIPITEIIKKIAPHFDLTTL